MRVIAGTAKGRRLKTPAGRRIRPTSEKVRGAIFDILYDVSGTRVLDLFAGTGAMGIEALSRGAEHVTFVDQDREALRIIDENLARTGLGDRARVRAADLRRPLAAGKDRFDLIFCDPPYDFQAPDRVLGQLASLLKRGGTAVFEHGATQELEDAPDLEMVDRRRWGSTAASFFRRRE